MNKLALTLTVFFAIIGASAKAQNIFKQLPYGLVINESTDRDLRKRGSWEVGEDTYYDMLGNFHAYTSEDLILTKIIFDGDHNHRFPKKWKDLGLQLADTRHLKFFNLEESSCALGTTLLEFEKILDNLSIDFQKIETEPTTLDKANLNRVEECESFESEILKSDHQLRFTAIKFTTNSMDFYFQFAEFWGRNNEDVFQKHSVDIGLYYVQIEESY